MLRGKFVRFTSPKPFYLDDSRPCLASAAKHDTRIFAHPPRPENFPLKPLITFHTHHHSGTKGITVHVKREHRYSIKQRQVVFCARTHVQRKAYIPGQKKRAHHSTTKHNSHEQHHNPNTQAMPRMQRRRTRTLLKLQNQHHVLNTFR